MKIQKHILMTLFIPLVYTSVCSADTKNSRCFDDHTFGSVSLQLNYCLEQLAETKDTKVRIDMTVKVAKLQQSLNNYADSNALLLKLETETTLVDSNFTMIHQLLTEIGINFYYLKNHTEAQHYFKKALDLAEVQQNLQALAQSYNSLGIVFKAQSRFSDALNAYQKSLKIRETLDEKKEIGSTLYNIGNVYILIEKFESAIKYHQRALDLYLTTEIKGFDARERVIHIKDRIAQSLSQLGKDQDAASFLEELIKSSAELPNKEALLYEPYLNLTNIYLKLNQTGLALETVNKTLLTYPLTTDQELLRIDAFARIYMNQEEYALAEQMALKGFELSANNKNHEYKTSFLLLMSELKNHTGQYKAAYDYKTRFIDAKESNLKQKYDTGIKYLENEIELTVQEKNLAVLQKNSLLQELKLKKQRILVLTSIMFGMLLISFIIWYIRKKSIERKKLLSQINYHKQQLSALNVPKQKLEHFFKEQTDPIVCINSFNVISYANQTFCDLFNVSQKEITGSQVNKILPELASTVKSISFNTSDLPEQNSIKHKGKHNDSRYIWVSTLASYDHCMVLSFQTDNQEHTSPTQTYQHIETINHVDKIITKLNGLKTKKHDSLNKEVISLVDRKLNQTSLNEHDLSAAYRQSLTHLMISNLEIWRKVTQGDRITLAEQSGVWKVTIDDGRLRTRALDRYLSLKALPKAPRWRAVVKTSHYILSECMLNPQQREFLNKQLEAFMSNLKAINSEV